MMSEWQPIETAPKDIDVLVYCNDTCEQFVAFDSLVEEGVFFYAHSKAGGYIGCRPNYWRHLPKPPETPSEASSSP